MTYKITKLNAYTVDIQLAGTTFRDPKELKEVHKALKNSKSHDVKFRYQKENKADPNAIMVFINNIHLKSNQDAMTSISHGGMVRISFKNKRFPTLFH